ncbi:MAG: hypothetical protein JWP22_951 [Ramlibacter sp.]|nr:hypothetical protein [Ramlibacter sp.]
MLGKPPNRRRVLRDLIIGSMMIVMLWVAIPRTEWYRLRYDEVTRTESALSMHPVNLALREHRPAEWKPIEEELRRAAAVGATESALLARMRVHHLKLARHYLIYAPADTVVRYGEAVLAALRELQAIDPDLCVRLAWAKAGPAFDPVGHLDPHTASDYEAAIAEIIVRSDTGDAVGSTRTEDVRDADPALACADTIGLMERALRQEPPLARRSLANMLRS